MSADLERIPPEIRGKVRDFQNRLTGAHVQWEDYWAREIRTSVLRRIKSGKRSFRQAEATDMVRRWRCASAAQFGQRGGLVEWHGSKKLWCVKEARLVTAKMRQFAWDGEGFEDSVDIAVMTTTLNPWEDDEDAIFTQNGESIAAFSCHALVRYWQRGFHPSTEALVDALWLGMRIKDVLHDTRSRVDFAIPVPAAGGHWFGRLANVFNEMPDPDLPEAERAKLGHLCFGVRTFHTEREERSDD